MEDQFNEPGDEAYVTIGTQMNWEILGVCESADLNQYLTEPGTLAEERWKALPWSKPERDTVPCWWLVRVVKLAKHTRPTLALTVGIHRSSIAQVNPKETDKSKPPSLLNRSLALVKLELNANRVATTAKLRHEFEQRADENADAVSVLHNHQHLWRSVGGPEPDVLFRPSNDDIENASRCCDTLRSMAKADDRDGLAEFSQEITQAVGNLKSVEWEDIRREKYFLTPPALFSELVRTTTSLISRQSAELSRRQEWLTADLGVDEVREIPISHSGADRYGIDLEEFKMKTGKKPREWKKAVRIAEWLTYNRHAHEWWVEGDRDAMVVSSFMCSCVVVRSFICSPLPTPFS